MMQPYCDDPGGSGRLSFCPWPDLKIRKCAVLCLCNRILTMKSGEIFESSTFKVLMRRKGYFYSLDMVSQCLQKNL